MDKSTKRTKPILIPVSLITRDIVSLRYPGSRSPFLKYPKWNKPCLRFDKAPETDFFFSLGASLTRQTSVSIREKYPLEPRVRLPCVPIMNITFPQVRESRFRNAQDVCFWNREFGNFIWWNLESWILESIIQLKETGMALTIGIRNPSSFDKESGIQNPRLSWIPLHGSNNYVVFCLKESQWCRKKE